VAATAKTAALQVEVVRQKHSLACELKVEVQAASAHLNARQVAHCKETSQLLVTISELERAKKAMASAHKKEVEAITAKVDVTSMLSSRHRTECMLARQKAEGQSDLVKSLQREVQDCNAAAQVRVSPATSSCSTQ
jgi:hypothetical protein